MTFNVTVVEGFGYGYSDMSASERSNKNISAELHEVLGKLNITQPYTLAGHSIAGFYMLNYANRYPAEVTAVIGIDPTVPKATGGPEEVEVRRPRRAAAARRHRGRPRRPRSGPRARGTGRRRVHAGGTGTHTPDDELEFWQPGCGRRDGTGWEQRLGLLRGISYPDALPVLAFVVADGSPEAAGKAESLENLLKNVQRHKIVPLSGGHYLHWTQSKPMAEEIRAFLAAR